MTAAFDRLPGPAQGSEVGGGEARLGRIDLDAVSALAY
jgi:hypothetical protein